MRVTWLKQDYKNVVNRIPSLHEGGERYVIRFSAILKAFLYGYNAPLQRKKLQPDNLKMELDDAFDEFHRGFAYEGVGMGLGARMLINWRERRQFEKHIDAISSAYLYQYYVGLGWWLVTRYGLRPSPYQRVLSNLHPLYGPVLYDGVGFKIGLFSYEKKPEKIRRFSDFGFVGERICYQGLGRSLWFVAHFNILKVLQMVEQLPSRHRSDTMSGVGLAVAYSFFDDIKWSMDMGEYVPNDLKLAFQQGLAFGWEARRLQSGNFEDQLNQCDDNVADVVRCCISAVHEAREDILHHSTEAEQQYLYTNWIDKVRLLVSHTQ